MKKYIPLVAAVLSASCLFACETKSADEYTIGKIYFVGSVTANVDDFSATTSSNGKVLVNANLSPYNELLTYLVLSGGDSFYANVNDNPGVELNEKSALGMVWYERTLNGVTIGDEIYVTLDREADSAPAVSSVTVPDGVWELQGRSSDFSRTEDTWTLAWTLPSDIAQDDELIVVADGSCIDNFRVSLPLSATSITFTRKNPLEAGEYSLLSSDGAALDTCSVNFAVTLTRRGHVSGSFHGGQIVAETVSMFKNVTVRP